MTNHIAAEKTDKLYDYKYDLKYKISNMSSLIP